MDTPICDFVREYAQRNALRLHMPGHKGVSFLGMERLDITEIPGADSLYEADGIIARSEANVSSIFGCKTFYSTEGSSQCIRAMLYLVLLYAKQAGKKPFVVAGRNAHKAFLTSAALLNPTVDWLYPKENAGYLSCDITSQELESYLRNVREKPAAVYLTSPDYLGNMADIRSLATVCHRYGVLLAVDNAHGAYLKFLPESLHPIDLGADLCCDSAHKTLPVLTGGAYLHLSSRFASGLDAHAKNALMLFGSTSPSYLILQSLDAANVYLEDYPLRLKSFLIEVDALKEALQSHGYSLYGSEPLKLTIKTKAYGYTGTAIADLLRSQNMEPEFADQDYLVLMMSPETGAEGLSRLKHALCQIPRQEVITRNPPIFSPEKRCLSIREAMLSASEILPTERCLGRILAIPSMGCPPAVPILLCGEQISKHALSCFAYYGITHCCVVKNG